MENNNMESSTPLPDEEIDLGDLAAIFQRRWIWIASGGLIGLAIAGITLTQTNSELPKPNTKKQHSN